MVSIEGQEVVSIEKEQELVNLEKEQEGVNLEEQEEVVSLLTPVVTLTEEEGEVTSVRRVARKSTRISSNT